MVIWSGPSLQLGRIGEQDLHKTPLAYSLYQLFWNAIDWVYPPSCGGCNQTGERWCATCQGQVHRLARVCPHCGDQSPDGSLCARCQANPPPFSQMRTWAAFKSPVREAIHRLKYKHDIGLGEALSRHLVELFDIQNWPVELVIPMPLNLNRLKERGYNQSVLLARPLALARSLVYTTRAVQRIRDTRPQVGLNAADRLQNVKDAFQAERALVTGKTILVVDDVATTGATIQACCTALLDAGARSVYALTLARSILGDDQFPAADQVEMDLQPNQTLY